MLIDQQQSNNLIDARSRRRSATLLGLFCSGFFLTPLTAAEQDPLSRFVVDERRQPDQSPNSRSSLNRKTRESYAVPSLDGSGNNSIDPLRASSNTPYIRLAPSIYSDGISAVVEGPDLRYISNRIFADGSQNFFSQNAVTQWAYNWGQFLDHSIGLRAAGSEIVQASFDGNDPLEFFTNTSGSLMFTRTAAAPGTGETTAREQLNTVSSYIDAWAVYGGTEERLEWLREGPVDGDMSNNGAKLLLTETGHLPSASARGDAASAPEMERVGQLQYAPDADSQVVIAGDVRANENIALTTVQTLFAREHNRIVDELPDSMTEQEKFDIARQLIIATQQYITYNEFLPALGLHLEPARGYNPDVDASVSTEFATVGYRAHSMIHGEIEMSVPASRFSEEEFKQLVEQGLEISVEDSEVDIAVPLNLAFGNPQLATKLGIDAIAAGLGGEPQYKNDEQIDNQLRSVMFQLPDTSVENPKECLDGPTLNECYMLVADIGSIDVFRGRDHGIALYNDLRDAYGLSRITSFAELTGEHSEEFPLNDEAIDSNDPINDPDILDFIELNDAYGESIEIGSEAADTDAVFGVRRTTLAARLKAIYTDVDNIDGFVGMISEPHLPASDLGELQHAIWKRQFEALRDGDANFYKWSKSLNTAMRRIENKRITYRQSLSDIIINNTSLESGDIQDNIFLSAE